MPLRDANAAGKCSACGGRFRAGFRKHRALLVAESRQHRRGIGDAPESVKPNDASARHVRLCASLLDNWGFTRASSLSVWPIKNRSVPGGLRPGRSPASLERAPLPSHRVRKVAGPDLDRRRTIQCSTRPTSDWHMNGTATDDSPSSAAESNTQPVLAAHADSAQAQSTDRSRIKLSASHPHRAVVGPRNFPSTLIAANTALCGKLSPQKKEGGRRRNGCLNQVFRTSDCIR